MPAIYKQLRGCRKAGGLGSFLLYQTIQLITTIRSTAPSSAAKLLSVFQSYNTFFRFMHIDQFFAPEPLLSMVLN